MKPKHHSFHRLLHAWKWKLSGWMALLLVGLGLLALPVHVSAAEASPPLVVEAGVRIDGNLATTSQDIVVDGEVTGDVTSWSGDITVRGRVNGDVVTYGGRVVIAAGAHVGGHVLAPGGGVQRDVAALVAGQTIGASGERAVASVIGLIAPPGSPGAGIGPVGRFLLGAANSILVLAFSLVWMTLWPRRTSCAALTLRALPRRSLTLGLLSTGILAVLAPPLLTLLSSSLVGLPLALLCVLIVHVPYIYGLAALIRAIGGGLAHEPTRLDTRTIGISGAAAVVIGLAVALFPPWGLISGYLLASPGLGAVILSRAGLGLPQVAVSKSTYSKPMY